VSALGSRLARHSQLTIDQCGRRLGLQAMEAAERADEHLEKGHPDLSATWQRIMMAKLQAAKPEPGETVQ
jgi:hypothetical protein